MAVGLGNKQILNASLDESNRVVSASVRHASDFDIQVRLPQKQIIFILRRKKRF